MADRSDFRISLKSVSGRVLGPLRPTVSLLGAQSSEDPEFYNDHFDVWLIGKRAGYDENVEMEWNEYYSPAVMSMGFDITISDLCTSLRSGGHLDVASADTVMEIQLQDSYGNPIPSPSLVFRVYTDISNDIARFFVAKKETSGGVTTYTTLSSTRGFNNSMYSFIYVCGGLFTALDRVSYGVGVLLNYQENGVKKQCDGEIFIADTEGWLNMLGFVPAEEEESPDYGPASEPGGYNGGDGPGPTFNATSDPWIDYPIKPGIAGLGLVNLYKCDVGSLVNLGAELFPDINFPQSLSDVGEVIAAVSDSIWNSKLIDYIVSAHIIPVDVDVQGAPLEDIKVGTRTMTGILARKISDDIIEFDCGSVHVDEYYTNFVDYRGTRCRCYVPFYGLVDVKPEYWQSATLSLKYLFNVVDGSFVAQLFSEVDRHQPTFKSMIGQYTGCACVHVPMTGTEYASMFGGMIANAGGMAAGLATSNPAMAATSAVGFAQSTAGGGTMGSNAYNASAGFYGYPQPYLLIERQISHFSSRYPQEKGLPLLVARKIGGCSGFTVAEDIILDGIACTSDEKERIRNYFKSGVIIRN